MRFQFQGNYWPKGQEYHSTAYGHYELDKFPGCNQIVVKTHHWIQPHGRGHGLGREQHAESNYKALDLGYDYMLCTVRRDNATEKHILATEGWKLLDGFQNSETGNTVEIWGRLTSSLRTPEVQSGTSA